jgi:hypothetical protein
MLNYCDILPGKKFDEVAAEVPLPEKMLYLCDQAGIAHALRGEMTEADAPANFNAKSSLAGVPFRITDSAETTEAGREMEEYDIWFTSQTHFGMRIANYTNKPVSKIVLGYKPGDCMPPGKYFYQKLMLITFKPIPPGKERLLKWRIPPDITFEDRTCIDIIRASLD